MSAIQEALERARKERELARLKGGQRAIHVAAGGVEEPVSGRGRRMGLGALTVLMAGGAVGVLVFLGGSGSIPGSQELGTKLRGILGSVWPWNAPRARLEEAPGPVGEGKVVREWAQGPGDPGQVLQEAKAMRLRGDLRGAERILRAWIERDPLGVEPMVALADLYAGELRRPDLAIPLYQRALLQGSPRASLLVNLGVAYLRAGELAKATEQLLRAVELQPGMSEAHYNLACALALQGKGAEAERVLERAASLDPRVRQWAAQDPDLASLRKSGEPGAR